MLGQHTSGPEAVPGQCLAGGNLAHSPICVRVEIRQPHFWLQNHCLTGHDRPLRARRLGVRPVGHRRHRGPVARGQCHGARGHSQRKAAKLNDFFYPIPLSVLLSYNQYLVNPLTLNTDIICEWPQDFHGILILEPCNYASNIAFCHAATEMCNSGAELSMSQEYTVAITQVAYA